jgi:hypothetical protein
MAVSRSSSSEAHPIAATFAVLPAPTFMAYRHWQYCIASLTNGHRLGSDFLLFIPATAPNLKAVLSYFTATVKMNVEGDVLISDDTIQGLGITQSFLNVLFGSIFLVARTPPLSSYSPASVSPPEMSDTASPSVFPHSAVLQPLPPRDDAQAIDALALEVQEGVLESFKSVLIACVPNPGYFVAGGVAGIVSRTSTAPLDRLKVYLIAQTGVAQEAVAAAKSGNILRAAANSWRPLAAATKELWQAGGMRSLYAGRTASDNWAYVANSPRKRLKCGQGDARISHQVWLIRSSKTRLRQA